MIFPDKFTDIRTSVVFLSSDIIRAVQRQKIIQYDILLKKIILMHGEKARSTFLPALSLLYAMGKISYSEEGDLIKFNE